MSNIVHSRGVVKVHRVLDSLHGLIGIFVLEGERCEWCDESSGSRLVKDEDRSN